MASQCGLCAPGCFPGGVELGKGPYRAIVSVGLPAPAHLELPQKATTVSSIALFQAPLQFPGVESSVNPRPASCA